MLLALKSLFASKERVYLRLLGTAIDRGFGFEAQRLISELGLLGWMHVVQGQGLAIEVEGPRPKLEKLIQDLRVRATRARIARLELDWRKFTGTLEDFRVRSN